LKGTWPNTTGGREEAKGEKRNNNFGQLPTICYRTEKEFGIQTIDGSEFLVEMYFASLMERNILYILLRLSLRTVPTHGRGEIYDFGDRVQGATERKRASALRTARDFPRLWSQLRVKVGDFRQSRLEHRGEKGREAVSV